MKRIIPLLLLALLFCSCQNEVKNWITMSVDTDDVTKYVSLSSNSYIQTKTNTVITISLSLLPESDDFIEVTQIYSTDPDVLLVESVDMNKRKIKAKTITPGRAKISVKTKSHGSTTTLPIMVSD